MTREFQRTQTSTTYTFSMTAAMTMDRVVAMQIVEGGSDAVIFENFLYRTVHALRSAHSTKNKRILVLLDNARTHRREHAQNLAEKQGFTVLYLAQYSPWL